MIWFSQLGKITPGKIVQLATDKIIRHFVTDSRKAIHADTACFFSIHGSRNDGHDYIEQLYHSGIKQFVVEKELDWKKYPNANFFHASSALSVLQDLAAFHRNQFHFPLIGITGSNAKTIVKEWLYQLLSPDFSIVKNPGSYNSQLGVPLSVLQIQEHHQLGIFEAGISKPGEMALLARIILPTIGVFTNIGSSHNEGFVDRNQKIQEKARLLEGCKTIIYCHDHPDVWSHVETLKGEHLFLAWGSQNGANVRVKQAIGNTIISYQGTNHTFSLPFADRASKENLIHCIVVMLHLEVAPDKIQERINVLKAVPMRLELKQGINQCMIIDDTYNNDLAGLQISLDFLASQQKQKKYIILSDILQSGLPSEELIQSVAMLVKHAGITSFYGIGPALTTHQKYFQSVAPSVFFPSTESFLRNFDPQDFHSALILIKGARIFGFEHIVHRLQRKIHGTIMEIDLNAIVQNLNYFKSILHPGVKLMVMVKALAYGSGSEEVANLLQYHKVDYLGVAYADEGVELRKNKITIPIMVMNPSEESFAGLLEYNLEPEIYSLKILRAFISFLGPGSCKVHLKIDTGMHRLGFDENDLPEVIALLRQHPGLTVASVFSHLAAADEAQHDEFSRQQVDRFGRLYQTLQAGLNINPMRHVLNSPGILRFPSHQFEMVRLGIGLYGIDPTKENNPDLQPVATLKTFISQIREIQVGETVGYGRMGKATREMRLATIAIGYADGFNRRFSGGAGVVLVNGMKAQVVGNVCMDMTMIDITGMEAKEGDEVIIFGAGLPIQEVAKRAQTVPYEILTNTSERVKRIFHVESI